MTNTSEPESAQALDVLTRRVNEFLDYLIAECGLAPNTISAYRNDLTAFVLHLHDTAHTDLNAVTPDAILQHLLTLRERGLAINSCARALAV